MELSYYYVNSYGKAVHYMSKHQGANESCMKELLVSVFAYDSGKELRHTG
jgi:hypothetical protein